MRLWQIQSITAPPTQPPPSAQAWIQAEYPDHCHRPKQPQPWSLTTDTKPPAAVETITADKWAQPTNQRPKDHSRRIHSSFTVSPNPVSTVAGAWVQAEYQDRYYPPKRSTLPSFTVDPKPLGVAETIRLDKWIQPTNQRAREGVKRPLVYFNNSIAIEETDIPFIWWQPTNLPPKDVARRQWSYPYFFNYAQPQAAAFIPQIWVQTEYPDRYYPAKKSTPWSLAIDPKPLGVAETIRLDKWAQSTNQRQLDLQRRQYLYPSVTIDARGLTQKEVGHLDAWVQSTNQPRFDIRRLQYQSPSLFYIRITPSGDFLAPARNVGTISLSVSNAGTITLVLSNTGTPSVISNNQNSITITSQNVGTI